MSEFHQLSRDLLAEIQVYRSHSSGLELGSSQGTAEDCYPGYLSYVNASGPFAPLPTAAPLQLKDEGRKKRRRQRELISFSTDILLEEERALRTPLGKVERYQDETLALPRSQQSATFLDKLHKRNTSRNIGPRTRSRSTSGPRGCNSLALRDHVVPEERSSCVPSAHVCSAARRRPRKYYEQINAHTGGGGTIDVGLDSTQMARIMRWHRIQCGGNKGKGSERDSASKTVEAIYGARKGGAFSTHIQKDFRWDSAMHLAALQRMAYEGKVIDGFRLEAAR